MTPHTIVSKEEWLDARRSLLLKVWPRAMLFITSKRRHNGPPPSKISPEIASSSKTRTARSSTHIQRSVVEANSSWESMGSST